MVNRRKHPLMRFMNENEKIARLQARGSAPKTSETARNCPRVVLSIDWQSGVFRGALPQCPNERSGASLAKGEPVDGRYKRPCINGALYFAYIALRPKKHASCMQGAFCLPPFSVPIK